MRKIFKFQAGTTPNWYAQSSMWDPLTEKTKEGETPQWYKSIYWNAPYNETAQASLNGWTPELNNTYASQNLRDNDHGHAADLYTAFQKNKAYTDNYKSVGNDIQSFYNTDGNKMSAEDFVKFYNENAEKIRQYWTTPKVYGSLGARDHNQRFRKMFASRSNSQNSDPWNIGYQEDLEDENGSSTWLRRMDRYEKDFDVKGQIPQSRLHTITLGDGTTATVYKKANGDIALYKTPSLNGNLSENSKSSEHSVLENHNTKKSIDWGKLNAFLPDILEAGRLAGSLNNNEKVYQASLAGIRPNLAQSYNTHRQVVGDETTKQSYYKMAAQGQSKAAKPFTSDADRQMSYMMEAKRVGDDLRAKGDLTDNAEIRRTSDESNQHQWANAQRNTEVANANIVQLNAANAAKQNLLANKYTADWTSWDNYLKSKETRMRAKQAENESIGQQIRAIEYQNNLLTDVNLAALKKAASDAYDKDPSSEDYAEKLRKYNEYKLKKMLEYYQSMKNPLLYAKSGIKFEYKRKEDLLYKSAKDAVEHFRKMAKMSDDSIQKSRKNPIKLTNHPKTKKMQQGGVAPFTVFTPAALGGETSVKTTATSTASEKSKSSDSLDLVKKLFQDAEGLPIDVNLISAQMSKVLKKARAFGEELSSSDLETLYLQSMQQINQAKHSQSVYNEAKKIAINNDAMGEFAVTSDGRYIVQDTDGKIGVASLDDIQKKKLNPLTNGQLISMREVSPNLAFSVGDNLMETVVSNGIGMTKIAEQLVKLKGTLGSSETTIEGYTRKESNDIKRGMELLADAPNGIYKTSQYTKDQQQQMKQAYGYIVSMLPKNMKAILTINAYKQGTTPDKMISYLLNAGAGNTSKFEIDAISGKASKSSSSSSDGESKFKYDAASALISGEGYSEVMEFNTGTSYAVKVNGRHTEFQKHSGENMGQCTMDEALQSTLKGVLDFNKATFGGSRLNSSNYNHILINDGTVIGVDLPVDSSGNPDFSMLRKLQSLDQELLKKGIEDTSENAQSVNAACQEAGLPAKYTNDGKLNPYSWGRFAAFQATTDESALQNKNAILGDMIKVADNQTREAYKGILQSRTATKKYDINNGIFGIGKDELYQGTIFVPVKSNYAAAAMSSGQGMTLEDVTDMDMKAQGYDKEKTASYKPGYKLSDLENE